MHKFNPANVHQLDSPEREKILPRAEVLKWLAVEPGQTVLDVGAGSGYFTLPIARLVTEKGRVLAGDISEKMLQIIKEKVQEEGLVNVETILMEGEYGISRPEGSAQRGLMVNVLHEVKQAERSRLLENVFKILTDQGLLIIVDWEKVETPKGPPVVERVSETEAQSLVEKAGFQTKRILSLGENFYLLQAVKNQ